MKEITFKFLQRNGKLIAQFIFTALFIGLASWFISHERSELAKVREIIAGAASQWIVAALSMVAFYILLQAIMYIEAFATVEIRLPLMEAISLFLKRNFISVFLPAGGVASMAFFTGNLQKRGVSKTQIFIGSSIYNFVGILTVVIVAIPAFLFVVTGGNTGPGKWWALLGVSAILSIVVLVYFSLVRKGRIYNLILRIFPKAEFFISGLNESKFIMKRFIFTILTSVMIEFVGIGLVYLSMKALHLNPSLSISIVTYIVVVLFLIISPFLRGLGTIEVSMTFVLMRSGFSNAESIAITLLFRFFEFWLPLFAGIVSFLSRLDKLLLRLLPALLIFGLGIINIVSVLTPALPERLKMLQDYIIVDLVSFSNSFVLVAGLFLLVTASFMLRGLRSAWWLALFLSIISVFGHITKGIDYEEATVAIFVIGSLLLTRKEYYVKTNPRLSTIGWQTALFSIAAVIIFGTAGFYFLDKKHFHIDFNLLQSVKYTLLNYFLVGSRDLIPTDSFARDFIYMIKISGFGSMAFLVYSIVKPYIYKGTATEEELVRAKELTRQFGKTSLDYFKTYYDKSIFAPEGIDAFIPYKVTGNFAMVLESPVARNDEEMKKCVLSFGKYCFHNSLRDIYYRVPEELLHVFSEIGMKSLFVGQEGIVDISTFSLEGGERKSIRNALNKIAEQGYTSHVNDPPLRDGLIQKLKAVSDDWLIHSGKEEIVFSQGLFDEKEIKRQTVISAESKEEKIISFMNIIPDYAEKEGTYDLLRKTHDAPNGIMDYMIVELFRYFKSIGIQYVNLGFAPMSGMDDPHNFPERSMKFAYEKIGSLAHYRGQREYKEKFKPLWKNKFLVYSNDYDLIQVPGALAKVIKP